MHLLIILSIKIPIIYYFPTPYIDKIFITAIISSITADFITPLVLKL